MRYIVFRLCSSIIFMWSLFQYMAIIIIIIYIKSYNVTMNSIIMFNYTDYERYWSVFDRCIVLFIFIFIFFMSRYRSNRSIHFNYSVFDLVRNKVRLRYSLYRGTPVRNQCCLEILLWLLKSYLPVTRGADVCVKPEKNTFITN